MGYVRWEDFTPGGSGSWLTFTPTVTLVGGSGNTVPEYSTNSGRYLQIGKIIFVDILLDGDGGNEGAGTGQINIALPKQAGASIISSRSICEGFFFTPSQFHPAITIAASGTTVQLSKFFDGGISTATGADQSSTSRTIRLKFFYEID